MLAISTSQDGIRMKREIEEHYASLEPVEEVRVIIATQMRELEGQRADEWLMTPEFGSQRSIQLLERAMKIVQRTALAAKAKAMGNVLQDGD